MVSQRLHAELKHPVRLTLDQPNPTQPNRYSLSLVRFGFVATFPGGYAYAYEYNGHPKYYYIIWGVEYLPTVEQVGEGSLITFVVWGGQKKTKDGLLEGAQMGHLCLCTKEKGQPDIKLGHQFSSLHSYL